jgi:hypothetical protein
MSQCWQDEHTQDWVVRDALLATFSDARAYNCSADIMGHNYFIGVMLRRWASRYPDAIPKWRSLPQWKRLIGWQRQPGDPAPTHRFDEALKRFFTAGDNPKGTRNPWKITYRQEIVERSNGKGGTYGFWLAEYAIGLIPSVNWQMWITLQPPPPPPPISTQQEWESEWIVGEERRCLKWYEDEMDLWSIDGRDTTRALPTPKAPPPMPFNTELAESVVRPRAPFTEPMSEPERLALAIDEHHRTGKPIPHGIA